jgi:creatinine amidohydrolase/Fe(II)-dependent formamide hydrolase-like protein
MGSHPSLATAEDGRRFLDVAATGLVADLERFLSESAS